MIDTITKKQAVPTSIADFLAQWEKFAKAYFWTPPYSASSRRYYESQNSMKISTDFAGHKIEGEIAISCSCKNISVIRELYIDGSKKRITALKKLIAGVK